MSSATTSGHAATRSGGCCVSTTPGDLLDTLDKKVGRENYVLAFTADHGVATIPAADGQGTDASGWKMTDMMALADAVVSKKFGPGHNAVEGHGVLFPDGRSIASQPIPICCEDQVLSAQPA